MLTSSGTPLNRAKARPTHTSRNQTSRNPSIPIHVNNQGGRLLLRQNKKGLTPDLLLTESLKQKRSVEVNMPEGHAGDVVSGYGSLWC